MKFSTTVPFFNKPWKLYNAWSIWGAFLTREEVALNQYYPYQSNDAVRIKLHHTYKGSGTLSTYVIQAPAFYSAFPYKEDCKYANPGENQEGIFSVQQKYF